MQETEDLLVKYVGNCGTCHFFTWAKAPCTECTVIMEGTKYKNYWCEPDSLRAFAFIEEFDVWEIEDEDDV
jgi:hypothetical protein